jgi:cell division cycle 2-like
MYTREAMFRGETEPAQIELIFSLLGLPQGTVLEKYRTYPEWEKISPKKTLHSQLATKYGKLMDQAGHGLALLTDLLDLNPKTRLTADAALEHSFFTTAGPPAAPTTLVIMLLRLNNFDVIYLIVISLDFLQ